MQPYNFFEDKGLSLSKISDETSCSSMKESSTFLRGPLCRNAKTTHTFLFLVEAPLDTVSVFYVTVTRKKFENVYCGYDSTAFCLVRSTLPLVPGQRYVIYGRLSRIKTFFLDSLNAEPLRYLDLCYCLL
jgi:hypothetical protein